MREVRIRWSAGDTVLLAEYLAHVARTGEWRALGSWWSQVRETRRADKWKPFTVGDYVRLRRRRAALRTGRRLNTVVPWRHYAETR